MLATVFFFRKNSGLLPVLVAWASASQRRVKASQFFLNGGFRLYCFPNTLAQPLAMTACACGTRFGGHSRRLDFKDAAATA
jgi:hypothetical protein